MKINLLKQISVKYHRAEIIRRINFIVLFGGSALFLLSIVLISGRYIYFQIRANALKQTTDQLEASYFSRSREVADYVRVKQILTAFKQISEKRFRYKDFLTEIYQLIPPDSSLVSIDFAVTNVVMVTVRFGTVSGYEQFLARLKSQGEISGFLFKVVAEDSLTRDPLGNYQVNLEIGI